MTASTRAGRRSRRPPAALLAVGACCAIVAAVGSAPALAATPGPRTSGAMFVQTAPHGSLTRVEGARGRFVLRLRAVNPQVVWFSDRPARRAGQITLGAFTGGWRGSGFASDPPNAVLSLLHGDDDADTVALELQRPRYDEVHRTLTYAVRRLRHAGGRLSSFDAATDRRVPRRFQDASLFIDNENLVPPETCLENGPPYICPSADLEMASLAGEVVSTSSARSDFEGATLSGADLSDATLQFVVLSGANVAGATFAGADLTGASLLGAIVVGADLAGADLSGASLRGAVLARADLSGANLTGADLTHANLSGANLTGAELGGVTFCQTTMPDGTLNNPTC